MVRGGDGADWRHAQPETDGERPTETPRLKGEREREGGAARAGPGRNPGAGGEAGQAAWLLLRGRKGEAAGPAGGDERGLGARLREDRIQGAAGGAVGVGHAEG